MSIFCTPYDDERFYVYGLFCQDEGPGYVKFGRTKRIGKRLTTLRTGCPIPILYFTVIGVESHRIAVEVEKGLHKKFKERRTTGEWFRFDFSSPDDKKDFQNGCAEVFAYNICKGHQKVWTKINAEKLKQFFDHERKDKRIEVFAKRRAEAIEIERRRAAIRSRLNY